MLIANRKSNGWFYPCLEREISDVARDWTILTSRLTTDSRLTIRRRNESHPNRDRCLQGIVNSWTPNHYLIEFWQLASEWFVYWWVTVPLSVGGVGAANRKTNINTEEKCSLSPAYLRLLWLPSRCKVMMNKSNFRRHIKFSLWWCMRSSWS